VHSLKLQLGSRTLVARCDPALHIEAESVLRLLLEIESHGKPLREESLIPLGWSRLSLRARGDELVVCEPRFDGDALAEVNEDITRTLSVLVDQAALTQRLGTASQLTAFDRTITVACGVLDQRRIYVERREPTTAVRTLRHDVGGASRPRRTRAGTSARASSRATSSA
jgi:hypothetical protein